MKLVDILPIIRPGSEWVLQGETYEGLDWLDKNTTKPTKEEIESALKLYGYSEKRKKSYPSIEDQLDTLYHEGYEGWKKRIQQVKELYPKGE